MRWLVLLVLLTTPALAQEPADYQLRSGGPLRLVEGARATTSLTLVPGAGLSIDGSAPLSLRLSGEGLGLDKRRLGIVDAADPGAEAPRFELAVTGQRAGAYTLEIEARFWLCGKKTCRPVRDTLSVPVTVTSSPR